MKYDWVKIFKEKDEKELIKIYSGNSHLNFEAAIYAGLELKNRGFDFRRIALIHNDKVARLQQEIENYEKLDFIRSKYFRNLLLNIVALSGLLILIIQHGDKFFQNDYNIIRLLLYVLIVLFGIATAKWSFNRFKRNKKKNIEKKFNLLNLMTTPNNQ